MFIIIYIFYISPTFDRSDQHTRIYSYIYSQTRYYLHVICVYLYQLATIASETAKTDSDYIIIILCDLQRLVGKTCDHHRNFSSPSSSPLYARTAAVIYNPVRLHYFELELFVDSVKFYVMLSKKC